MSLRARFVVAACLVTVVRGLVVAVLPGAIERSQLEQVDKRLTEIVPVAVAVVTDRLRLRRRRSTGTVQRCCPTCMRPG